jgi:ribose 5-phosphate isomerase B
MVLAFASDHAGFELKQHLIEFSKQQGISVVDLGTHSAESVDYPDYGHSLAAAVLRGEASLGVAICGSGNGINIALNRHQGIRSILAWNSTMARMGKLHNDANVLTLPGRYMDFVEAEQSLQEFVKTDFEGGRHQGRVEKLDERR